MLRSQIVERHSSYTMADWSGGDPDRTPQSSKVITAKCRGAEYAVIH